MIQKETSMWTRFSVRWEFLTSLCSSTPGDSNLIERWLDARKPKARPANTKSITEIATEVVATLAEPEEEPPTTLVFQRVAGGLVMRAATVRAHIKDCAQVLSSLYVGRIEREKTFAVKVKNAIYWPPESYWIPILSRDGGPMTEPTGVKSVPVHSMTPQGPKNALKAYEYVDNAVMVFPILVLTQPGSEATEKRKATPPKLVVSEADIRTIFMYGGTHGYAGERSLDGGRYSFEMKPE